MELWQTELGGGRGPQAGKRWPGLGALLHLLRPIHRHLSGVAYGEVGKPGDFLRVSPRCQVRRNSPGLGEGRISVSHAMTGPLAPGVPVKAGAGSKACRRRWTKNETLNPGWPPLFSIRGSASGSGIRSSGTC